MSDNIKDQVLAIKEAITNVKGDFGAYQFLDDALSINYKIDSNGDCIGGEVLVCFGGPTVWVDTEAMLIRGYWWGDTCLMHYHDDPMGLNDAVIELGDCR